jgi:phenylpropionate dioxygenase-like ring-hydroxylating dioxygenase large terminal subunit
MDTLRSAPQTTGAPETDRPGDFRPGAAALRDAWFPVAHSSALARGPVARSIHSSPVAVFRDRKGLARAVRATVPARRIEALPARWPPSVPGGDPYPVVERYGYAWVWYGDEAAADPGLIPDVPWLYRDRPLPRHMYGTVIFDCAYELVCENLLDLTHGDFVHGWLLGDPFSDSDEVTVETTSETITMTRVARGRRTPPAQRLFCLSPRQSIVQVAHVWVRSGAVLLSMRSDPPGYTVRLFHPNVPESPTRTRTSFAFHGEGNFLFRNVFPFVAHTVGRQDNRVLKPQNPRYLVGSDRADCSSRFDAAGLRYRKTLRALVARQAAGDTAYQGDWPGDAADILRVNRVE